MAIAFQPPHITAQQQKQADLMRRMNSVDPTERCKAKEEAMSSYAADFGRAMAAQAEQTVRAYQAEIRRCEEADRKHNHYKQLPKDTKITKSY